VPVALEEPPLEELEPAVPDDPLELVPGPLVGCDVAGWLSDPHATANHARTAILLSFM
jgi:hypothetical protein